MAADTWPKSDKAEEFAGNIQADELTGGTDDDGERKSQFRDQLTHLANALLV